MPLWNPEEHQAFVRRLLSSSRAVFAVAAHFHVKGATVEIPALAISPAAAENVNHTDSGDLFVTLQSRDCLQIKHRKREFTCAHDWPDPHVFVSNVGAVDRVNNVSAYWIVNKPLTHAAVIRKRTKLFWYKHENQPSNVVQRERVYCCPLRHIEFIKLEELP